MKTQEVQFGGNNYPCRVVESNEVNNTEMPVDLVSVVDNIPNAETVVYNQIIFLPSQKRELDLCTALSVSSERATETAGRPDD